jgi:hypothetical protein
MERDFNYENNNIAYDCQYTEEDGGGIKCKNYEVCESVLPKWWFDCKASYLCTNCDMMFGTWTSGTYKQTGKGVLEINDNIECPICIECKRGISFPRCNHMVCIDCFKRCMYGDESGEPVFPYPDIYDEYYEDIENPKWKTNNYPLIEIYNRDYDIWEYNKNNEQSLRNCPVCRA